MTRTAPHATGPFLVGDYIGVIDGARTRGIRLHKPALYQLSYDHHADCDEAV